MPIITHQLDDLATNQIHELTQCADLTYFIENYCKIKHPLHGIIPFTLYPHQHKLISSYQEGNTIILTPRQMGTSVTTCAYLLWCSIFHMNKTTLIISDTNATAMELLRKIYFMYDNLPTWMRPIISHNTKHLLCFNNGSSICAHNCSIEASQGRTVSYLYCDNFNFVNPQIAQAFWEATYPTLTKNSQTIITSSLSVQENIYNQLWNDPKELNGFKHIQLMWDEYPDRSEEFKDSMINLIGIDKWRSEYECQFI